MRHEREVRFGRKPRRQRNDDGMLVVDVRIDARETARTFVSRDARAMHDCLSAEGKHNASMRREVDEASAG